MYSSKLYKALNISLPVLVFNSFIKLGLFKKFVIWFGTSSTVVALVIFGVGVGVGVGTGVGVGLGSGHGSGLTLIGSGVTFSTTFSFIKPYFLYELGNNCNLRPSKNSGLMNKSIIVREPRHNATV